MRARHLKWWCTVLAGALLLAACISPPSPKRALPPELVPVPGFEGTSVALCRRDNRGLVLRLRNPHTLNMPQGQHRMSVRFGAGSGVPVQRPSPLIGPGGEVDVVFPIPPSCWTPDCSFSVWRDDENVGAGTCLG